MNRLMFVLAILAYAWSADPAGAAESFGCESNPTGEPIGGGTGYSRIHTPAEADFVVSTPAQLLSALSSASSGDIVYVDDAAKIDLTGSYNIMIPGGVTLASGRGRNGSLGGMIYTTTFAGTTILFKTSGPGVRITGVRLCGPYSGMGRTVPYAHGFQALHDNVEIDNCELLGWNYSAIATTSNLTNIHVHHCYIHHNIRNGLGYGVAPSRSFALVEGCLFDYCRHAIASSGQSPSSYEARYNLYMEHAIGHIYDMHGANDFEKTIMQGNWRFDESTGTAAKDSSEYGGNNAVLVNFNASTCHVAGKINNALQFDGIDDYVDCGARSNLAGSKFSLTAWIKPTALTGVQAIASKGDSAASGYGYSLRLVGSTLEGTVHNSIGTMATGATATATIPAGVWTHVAMTFNGSTVTLYINGVSRKTFACSGVRQSSSYALFIGRDSTSSSSHFSGLMDEVRCYNTSISAADVLRHYNLLGDIAGDTILIHHNTVRCLNQSAVVIRGVPSIGCWIDHNWFWLNNSNVIRQTNATGNMIIADNLYGSQAAPPNPADGTMLGEWRFDEGSGLTTADSSGNGRTGTLTNMDPATSWVGGHTNTALAFDGVNDSVSCGTSLTQTDNIAIDAWIKFDQFAEYTVVLGNNLFDIYNRSGWAGNKLYFRYRINEYVLGGDSAWAGYTAVKSTTELSLGTWYHVVGTRNGNKMRIFINDVLERELDCLAGYTIAAPTTLRFGVSPFKGALDEIRIFTPALEYLGTQATITNATLTPQAGTPSDLYTFRVKYTDPRGVEPRLGHPRLRIYRSGVEFAYVTPLTMMAVDSTPIASGRNYVASVKLPRGSDYTCNFEALDSLGMAATGSATIETSGPTVTTGNTAPVLQSTDETNYVESAVYPLSGNSDTTFDFRIGYVDIDNDPPQAGYPKLRITRGGVDIPGSPFTMTQVNTNSYLTGRKYQLLKKLSAASDYSYQYIARDSLGAAADPSIPASLSIVAGATVWTELYQTSPITSGTATVNVVFAQPVTGFTQSDLAVANANVTGFTGSGAGYSFSVTPITGGVITINIPAGVCAAGSTSNLAATQLGWVGYPAGGANEIWVGHGYPGARLGTMTDPFDLVADAIPWLKSTGTMRVMTGSSPETIRITKPMRVESYAGPARIGTTTGLGIQ